ncbi:MAG: glycoside hydrolase family 99-like domain-containing protein [Verrucomicrobia bacterium]|nr:glycoside hydrolase family 99-like domain-containing protein [Verrucomicrobiota bacterium]
MRAGFILSLAFLLVAVADLRAAGTNANIRLRSFLYETSLGRAHRPAVVSAVIENSGDASAKAMAQLVLPNGIKPLSGATNVTLRLDPNADRKLTWKIEAAAAMSCELKLQLCVGGSTVTNASVVMQFLPAMKARKLPYIPEPVPARTQILVGAHNCPLWEADKPQMWANILKHPERTPALGFYSQENPEVADWETKWAVEHGVSFFIYCWYRASQGEPVKQRFGSAIHDALFKSRFVDKLKFTIMWENQSRGTAGVADERDLMTNLLPFWMENYFKHPSYLKVDNKPVLFIYRPEFLVKDLGSIEAVRRAFDRMRQACRDAGFAGLYLLGEYRGLDARHLALMKQLGLDYTFAYCWGIPNSPTPPQAIEAQMQKIQQTQSLGILPQVVTVSQAWSGWRDEGSIWKIPPSGFEKLLRQAKDFIGTLPPAELGSKMLILDNWNEWGEGHYIAPYREYGFGYLDAVRNVFADPREPHVDLLPDDIGRGPYDTAYWTRSRRDSELRKLATKQVHKAGAPEDGLIGWWAFDEAKDSPVALDYSGHRLSGVLHFADGSPHPGPLPSQARGEGKRSSSPPGGQKGSLAANISSPSPRQRGEGRGEGPQQLNRSGGAIHDAKRAKGLDGNALVCNGGCVIIENSPLLSPTNALTIECWVKADSGPLRNNWIVNRVFGGDPSAGYRLGVVEGKPCFQIPLKPWTHHLAGNKPLPVGEWVHLAATFDGQTMRLYMDGKECGTMPRPAPIKPNTFHLCLGNYEIAHAAHFNGLLDEVRLYARALTVEEVRQHFGAMAGRR